MTYFYDYFAKEYREKQKDRLLSFPAAMFRNIGQKMYGGAEGVEKRFFWVP